MKYPKKLVHGYGAKAGVLIYVAQELPDIPQADMTVKTPNQSIDEVLKIADSVPILWPRIFRSSAVAELDGYEGDFPSMVVEGFEQKRKKIINPNYDGPYLSRQRFDSHVRRVIEEIENFPRLQRELEGEEKYPGVPDKICVIIAKKSPSSYFGTLIKHPNQDNFFIMSVTDARTRDLRGNYVKTRSSVYSWRPEQGVKEMPSYLSQRSFRRSEFEEFAPELEKLVEWHDRIASLPLMDQDWTYQLEFGLDPVCLYQVRPFKPKVKADFEIEGNVELGEPLVIGVTPREGINVRVERNVEDAAHHRRVINPNKDPSVMLDRMRIAEHVDHLENLQANLWYNCAGILSHKDIKAMRRAQVTALFDVVYLLRDFWQDHWVNIVSDGERIDIRRIEK